MRTHPAGRSLTVFPDDTYIVSYPRSGNTWTRFLIGNLVGSGNPMNFANLDTRVPEIHLTSDRAMLRVPRPRILKSHECFDPRYRSVIYIVRDPRDLAISLYYYSMKRRYISDGYRIETFVPRFVAGEFFDYCGTWSEHVSSWLAILGSRKKLLLLRYEDMLDDTERELARIAKFLGIEGTPDKLRRVVQLSSAARMRTLEKQQASQWILTRNTRQDIPFVRTAIGDCWKVDCRRIVWHKLSAPGVIS
jgi:Sulfotransferase domain